MIKPKENPSNAKDHIVKTVYEYAGTATVHGISYVFDVSKILFDRCLWLLVFLSFFGLAIHWIVKAYVQWQDDPVITTVKTTGAYT